MLRCTLCHPRAIAKIQRRHTICNITNPDILPLCKVIHLCQKVMAIYTSRPNIQFTKPSRDLWKECDILNIFSWGRAGNCIGWWCMACSGMHAIYRTPWRHLGWRHIWRIWWVRIWIPREAHCWGYRWHNWATGSCFQWCTLRFSHFWLHLHSHITEL